MVAAVAALYSGSRNCSTGELNDWLARWVPRTEPTCEPRRLADRGGEWRGRGARGRRARGPRPGPYGSARLAWRAVAVGTGYYSFAPAHIMANWPTLGSLKWSATHSRQAARSEVMPRWSSLAPSGRTTRIPTCVQSCGPGRRRINAQCDAACSAANLAVATSQSGRVRKHCSQAAEMTAKKRPL